VITGVLTSNVPGQVEESNSARLVIGLSVMAAVFVVAVIIAVFLILRRGQNVARPVDSELASNCGADPAVTEETTWITDSGGTSLFQTLT
jgi:hypothetical protein